jgi:hypothetical protein
VRVVERAHLRVSILPEAIASVGDLEKVFAMAEAL